MWPDLIEKSKKGGLDVIDTYVFWDLHEPVQGQVTVLLLPISVRFVLELIALIGIRLRTV